MAAATTRTTPADRTLIDAVDAAVRSVLVAMQPPASRRVPTGAHVFPGRLFSLRHAESLSAATHEVQLVPGTVVTPLARDLLKQRRISLRQVAPDQPSGRHPSGEWAFAIEDPAGAGSGLMAALRRVLHEDAWTELEAALSAARWVAGVPHRGALLVTDEAPLAVWRACQVAGVRAATAADPEGVIRAVRRLGVNLLVVEHPGKSISWLRQLGATFRRAGMPVCPDGLDDGKEACRCASPR